MKVILKMMKWMEKVFNIKRMGINMMENLKKVKKKEEEFIIIVMEKKVKVNGKMMKKLKSNYLKYIKYYLIF